MPPGIFLQVSDFQLALEYYAGLLVVVAPLGHLLGLLIESVDLRAVGSGVVLPLLRLFPGGLELEQVDHLVPQLAVGTVLPVPVGAKLVLHGTGEKVTFRDLSPQERGELIKKDSRYGTIICRCETVTEGEIVDAIHSPTAPRSVDAIKRRCNAGMGRCQGGFCGPRVLEILCRELGLDPREIPQDKDGSYIVMGETKTRGGNN